MACRLRLALAFIGVLALSSAALPAASPRDSLVVSTAWLADHLHDPNLVLLHIGDAADFAKGHIPGAHEVKLEEISQRQSAAGLSLEMLPLPELKAKLEALGVSDASHVVIYESSNWFSPSTRVMATLDYAGLGDRVSWMNGGFETWKKEGRTVATTVTPIKPGKLSPLKAGPVVVDSTYVRAHLNTPGVVILDARDAIFYEGRNDTVNGMHKRLGHIVGAKSLPYDSVADDTPTLKSAEELQRLFTNAGVKPGDTVVVYCHVGQQATTVVFAARTLGITARLYDGSFTEWEQHPDWPVEIK
jgi:thiosulfate/3-mercaptopyruvate sulfurtransferase